MSTHTSSIYGERILYRPIDAAIRWCGLQRSERQILRRLGPRTIPQSNEFPRWPRLRLCVERIFDGVTHGELPYEGMGSAPLPQPPSINDPLLQVRHVALKEWMARYYPSEKPPFLFDEFERRFHSGVDVGTLSVLLMDREAARVQLAKLGEELAALTVKHEALVSDHAKFLTDTDRTRDPGPRSEGTYLNIIGGLVTLLLGSTPSGIAYSTFRSMDAVISALLAHFEGRPGLSERTLWQKLAQARRHLDASR